MDRDTDVIEAARAAGFDLHLIDTNLALTLEERLRQHDQALDIILELQQAQQAADAKLQ
jgi:hypothetical protein